MTYEELLNSPDAEGVEIINYKFDSDRIKGLYCDGTIALNDNIATNAERACVLSEELGHYHTTIGDIINQIPSGNRKQELRARIWAYNKLIGLTGIVDCYKSGCQNPSEMAEHLNISEQFLLEAMAYYKGKYGISTQLDNYVIFFEPALSVLELI